MTELIAALGALLAGVFGTQGVQRYRRRKNGNDDAGRIIRALDRVATAIKDEGAQTRAVLGEHHRSTTVAFGAFSEKLADMSKDSAVAHKSIQKDLERIGP